MNVKEMIQKVKAGQVAGDVVSEALDKDAVTELKLFIDNTYSLYNQMTSIQKNLMTKRAQGKYDPKLSVKLWMYLVDAGAKTYTKEYDSSDAKWNDVFPKDVRMAVAQEFAEEFEEEAELGNYDDMLPKKYRK